MVQLKMGNPKDLDLLKSLMKSKVVSVLQHCKLVKIDRIYSCMEFNSYRYGKISLNEHFEGFVISLTNPFGTSKFIVAQWS